MKMYLYKQKWLFCQGDLYFWRFCCMNNFCISQRLIYIPTHSFGVLSSRLISQFWLLPCDSVCVTVAFWVNFKEKHFFMNMNISPLTITIMYDSIFAQMYIFLIEKYFLQFLLKAKLVNDTRNTYIWAKRLSYIVVG